MVEFARDVYSLSVPQGFGMMHYLPGTLSEEEAEEIVSASADSKDVALSMDYVQGRACKMTVFRDGDRLFVNSPWFDHEDGELAELLSRHGVDADAAGHEHSPSCECGKCRGGR